MITAHELTFTYPGGSAPAVKGITFEVKPGEILGFLGPSGAGKSTTQKILTGLLTGYSGDVTMFDRPLKAWGHELYTRIGVSFELPNHYLRLTALENLSYFASLYGISDRARLMGLLERVDLADDAHKRVAQFSKGMKMRLNFVRSLLHRPQMLFLDEPTSGLDPVNAQIVKTMIKEQQAAGVTVFLTTHDMAAAAALSDRVAFMVEGRIALMDTPKALQLRFGARAVTVEYRNGAAALAHSTFPLDDLADNAEFLRLLRQTHIETIHTQETTLENIFIRVTGKTLEGES